MNRSGEMIVRDGVFIEEGCRDGTRLGCHTEEGEVKRQALADIMHIADTSTPFQQRERRRLAHDGLPKIMRGTFSS